MSHSLRNASHGDACLSIQFDPMMPPGLRYAYPGLSRRNAMKTELYYIAPLALILNLPMLLRTGSFLLVLPKDFLSTMKFYFYGTNRR